MSDNSGNTLRLSKGQLEHLTGVGVYDDRDVLQEAIIELVGMKLVKALRTIRVDMPTGRTFWIKDRDYGRYGVVEQCVRCKEVSGENAKILCKDGMDHKWVKL